VFESVFAATGSIICLPLSETTTPAESFTKELLLQLKKKSKLKAIAATVSFINIKSDKKQY